MKLHLGCGTRRAGLDGFTHVDIRPETHPDVIADITNLDGQFDTVDMIYWCHGLEHVPRPLVVPTLAKLYGMLNHGGILRLSLPNFHVLAELYVLRGMKLDKVFGPIMGRQDYPENTHYGLYDSESLYKLLVGVGFVNVHSYDPREVWPPEFDDYSLAVMDGQYISLNAEAVKP